MVIDAWPWLDCYEPDHHDSWQQGSDPGFVALNIVGNSSWCLVDTSFI